MKGFNKKRGFQGAVIIGVLLILGLVVMPWIGEVGAASGKESGTAALWVHFLGKLHPLFLHLPIGILVLVLVMEGLSLLSFGRYQAKTAFALGMVVFSSILAVILGYFLYLCGDFTGELIEKHKRDGILFTIAVIVLFLLKLALEVGIEKKWLKPMYFVVLGVSGALMVSAGHYGGEITHGDPLEALPSKVRQERAAQKEDAEEKEKEEQKEAPTAVDPVVYSQFIHPILDRTCISCHRADKKKGGLRLDSYEAMVEGGDFVDTLVPGDIEESALISTIHLPLDDDEHMPPEEKPQPTAEEILVLEWWVKAGASATVKLSELEASPEVTEALSTIETPTK